MGESATLLLLAAMLVLFWLVVIRPARRQQSAVSQIQRNLAVGDRVVLSSGIFGTIVTIDDSRVRLEVAPGTVIEVARQVVVRKADETPEPGDRTDGETKPDPDAQTGTTENTDRPDAGKA